MAAVVAAFLAIGAAPASAQSSAWGDALSNLVQGVFSKSDLTLEDICGEWTADGSAVSFKSDNLLEKAGGLAAAGAIENKLDPYYKKLGLNNAVLTVNKDGTFTLATKLKLSGTVKANGDGTFEFSFDALKLLKLGSLTAYVQKSGNHLDVMFDATKLKTLISGIAKVSGISIAKTAATLLDSYEGLCVGFSMNRTGGVDASGASASGDGMSTLGSVLGNILGGGQGSQGQKADEPAPAPAPETESKGSGSQSSGSNSGLGGALFNILKSTTGK